MTVDERAERIWQVVASVPSGRVATYGQVAALADVPRGARLVGRTLSRLPKGTRLPWHRIINARGEISLSDSSAGRQRDLLESEGIVFVNGRVNLAKFRWQP